MRWSRATTVAGSPSTVTAVAPRSPWAAVSTTAVGDDDALRQLVDERAARRPDLDVRRHR